MTEFSDLTDTEQESVTSLHIIVTFDDPDRVLVGHIGYNTFAVRRSPDFADPAAEGDVVQVSQNEKGTYEATARIGRRANKDFEWQTYQLPWDHQQMNFDSTVLFLGEYQLPAAIVYVQDRPAREVHYGNAGTVEVTSVAYWGHSARFKGFVAGLEPAQKISLAAAAPNPAPVTLTLMSGKYPGDPSVPVEAVVDATVVYRGPDTPTVVDLPADWIAAFAAGVAGSIRFAPTDSTPGVTRLHAGPAGSLTLHR